MATAEDYFVPALTGAGTGAAKGALIGSTVAPGLGTKVGAGIGAGVGLIGGLFQGRANNKKKKALAQARKEMQELSRKQYAQRMADLQNAMAYFKPVDSTLRELYGSDAATDFVPPGRLL